MHHQPLQKGFACGFITPIVHCLNLKLPVINSKVVRTYAEVAPILGFAPEISSALPEYPASTALLSTLIDHLELGLHGFDEWDVYCHWNVAKKLGGKEPEPIPVLVKKPTVPNARQPVAPSSLEHLPGVGPSPARHPAPRPLRGGDLRRFHRVGL